MSGTYGISSIVECLVLQDGVRVSKQRFRQDINRYVKHLTIDIKSGSGLLVEVSVAIMQVIEDAMHVGDETNCY